MGKWDKYKENKWGQYKETIDITPKSKEEIGAYERPTPKVINAIPSIMQFGGGIAGGILGGLGGQPYMGAATGGTLGRGLGMLQARTAEQFYRKPSLEKATELVTPLGMYKRFQELTPEERKRYGKAVENTASIELIFSGVGNAASKAVKWLNRGVTGQWLGPRVAERGINRGWKKILNPDYYKKEVPQFIKSKLSRFFPNLTKKVGGTIDDLIKVKYKKSLINITDVKNEIKSALPKSGDPTDLLELHAPKSQKQLLQDITNMLLKQKGNVRNAKTIWQQRKFIDKSLYGKSWTPDAKNYLLRVRNALNTPIKSLGDDVAENFNTYHWIKDAELNYGKNFEVRIGIKGEMYSPKIESFAKRLLNTGNDDMIKELNGLNNLLSPEQQIMDDLLDYAAAETLDKPVAQFGIFTRTALGLTGGRKGIANIGKFGQTPAMKGLGKGIGRFIPTMTSEEVNKPYQLK